MKNAKILVIDDDLDVCLLLDKYLTKKGYDVDTANSGNTGKVKLKETSYDLVLCDFRLPDIDGLEFVTYINRTSPTTKVIIITGYSDVRMAVKVIKRGALDYVTKPIHPEEIVLSITNALNQTQSENKTSRKKKSVKSKKNKKPASNFLKGSSKSSEELYELVDLVAPTDMSVIVLGESGTGKEVLANYIHQLSHRKANKFVAVDCGALPKELAGSELFGHVKGAFTGALADKIGYFEYANNGTLFLDEIGNLSYDNQVKLLRALQEKKIKPLGSNKDIDVDVRILAATNENLFDLVQKGEFREDLYYRLNEFKINLKPLRERKTEIEEFINYMLEISSHELNMEQVPKIEKEALKAFKEYNWPGNIRELKNIIKRSVLLSRGDKITFKILPEAIQKPSYYDFSENSFEFDSDEITSLKDITERAEKAAIIKVLKKTGFNKSKAAKILKVDRKTLYNKMTAFGLD